MFSNALVLVFCAHVCMSVEIPKDKEKKSVYVNFAGAGTTALQTNISDTLKTLIRDEANIFCNGTDYKKKCCKDTKYESLGNGAMIVATNTSAEENVFFLHMSGDANGSADSNVRIEVAILVPQDHHDNELCVMADDARRRRSLEAAILHRMKRHPHSTESPTPSPSSVYLDPDITKAVLQSNRFRTQAAASGFYVGDVSRADGFDSTCSGKGDDDLPFQPWLIALLTIFFFLLLLLFATTIIMCCNRKKTKGYSKELMGSRIIPQ
ncbi:uncharacterized protein [Branchiostoma lanceolatum]|uniref:Hypp5135 protein n=1 Tax=Branchiostoma lanceolatum TaxID=7740 RepID=A0A8K0F105_BRALA|nr:Hypp5135 [Branchiostoma lanceolatum]